MNRFELIAKIGAGGQGRIYKCLQKINVVTPGPNSKKTVSTRMVALKEVKVEDLDELNFALREAQACLRLKHPNIVTCYEVFIDKTVVPQMVSVSGNNNTQQQQQNNNKEGRKIDDENGSNFFSSANSQMEISVVIVFEFCDKGSLSDVITTQIRNKNAILEEKKVLTWFLQMCKGIHYMHLHNILHRDLKPANIFLTADGKIRIGDLGLARQFEVAEEYLKNGELDSNFTDPEFQLKNKNKNATHLYAVTTIGSRFFAAPEILGRKPYNEKLDIWGLGCILGRLLTLEDSDYVYEVTVNLQGLLEKVKNRGYSDYMVQLLQGFLKINPHERVDLPTTINSLEERIRIINEVNSAVSFDPQTIVTSPSGAIISTGINNNNNNNTSFINNDQSSNDITNSTNNDTSQADLFEDGYSYEIENLKTLLEQERHKAKTLEESLDKTSEELFFTKEQLSLKENPPPELPSFRLSVLKKLPQTKKDSWENWEFPFKELVIIDENKDENNELFCKGTIRGQNAIIKTIERNGEENEINNSEKFNNFMLAIGCDIEKKIRHQNIVEWIGYSIKANNVYLIYENCKYGSLGEVLFNLNISVNFERKIAFCKQIARAMLFLHSQTPPIVYYSLTTARVMVTDKFECKLIGFLRSKVLPPERKKTSLLDDKDPSSSSNNQKDSKDSNSQIIKDPPTSQNNIFLAADVMKYGRVLFDIYSRRQIKEISSKDIRDPDFIERLVYIENNNSMSDEEKAQRRSLIQLGVACLQDDISKRPTFSTIVYRLSCLDKTNK